MEKFRRILQNIYSFEKMWKNFKLTNQCFNEFFCMNLAAFPLFRGPNELSD